MKRVHELIFLFFLILFPNLLKSQIYGPGPRSLSMGRTGAVLPDPTSFQENPALPSLLSHNSFSLASSDNFFVPDLRSFIMTFSLSTNAGTFTLMNSYYGIPYYNRIVSGINYSIKWNHLSAGIRLSWYRIKFGESYGSVHNVLADAGFVYELNKPITIGVCVHNPGISDPYGNLAESLPAQIKSAVSYKINPQVLMAGMIALDSHGRFEQGAGIEYKPHKSFTARIGLASDPLNPSFGFSIPAGSFRADFSFGFHQALGWSLSTALIYEKSRD